MQRVKTGVKGFDNLFDPGIPSPSFIIIAGHPGTGKSTFAIQFLLNGIKHANEKGVYVSFLEPQSIFSRNVSSSYGLDIDTHIKDGTLRFLEYAPMSSATIADIGATILNEVVEINAHRLVIDSLNALFADMPAVEQRRIMEILINRVMKDQGCTVVGILEQSIGTKSIGFGMEEFVADGLISFESYVDGLDIKKRAVVRKIRGTQHSSRYQQIILTSKEGISFLPLVD